MLKLRSFLLPISHPSCLRPRYFAAPLLLLACRHPLLFLRSILYWRPTRFTVLRFKSFSNVDKDPCSFSNLDKYTCSLSCPDEYHWPCLSQAFTLLRPTRLDPKSLRHTRRTPIPGTKSAFPSRFRPRSRLRVRLPTPWEPMSDF